MIARRARTGSLVALGALALHQLRYLVAYGHGSGRALSDQGHSYLAELAPLLVALAGASLLGALIVPALVRLDPQRDRGPRRSLTAATALFATVLFGVFAAQELAEGALVAGHPGGLAALFAGGGWVSLPLAFALGALCAVAALWLERVERALASPFRRSVPFIREPATLGSPQLGALRSRLMTQPLAFGLARRGPPLLPGD